MQHRYKRPDRGDHIYNLILGAFILALVMGLAGTCYFAIHYNGNRFLFLAFLIWTLFYAVTIYCWIDEDRYDRYEYLMTPVLFGAVFLLLIALFIGCLIINVPRIASGEDVITNVIATVIAEVSLGAGAFFIYRFYVHEYLYRLFHRERD